MRAKMLIWYFHSEHTYLPEMHADDIEPINLHILKFFFSTEWEFCCANCVLLLGLITISLRMNDILMKIGYFVMVVTQIYEKHVWSGVNYWLVFWQTYEYSFKMYVVWNIYFYFISLILTWHLFEGLAGCLDWMMEINIYKISQHINKQKNHKAR